MSPSHVVPRPMPLSSLSPASSVGRHQLWLDDAGAGAPADRLALRLDLSSLDRVPPSSIRGPLRPRVAPRAWPLAGDEPPTLSVRRASLHVG